MHDVTGVELEPANRANQTALACRLDQLGRSLRSSRACDSAFFFRKFNFEQPKLAQIKSSAHAVWERDGVFTEVRLLREHQNIHEVGKRAVRKTFLRIVDEPFAKI